MLVFTLMDRDYLTQGKQNVSQLIKRFVSTVKGLHATLYCLVYTERREQTIQFVASTLHHYNCTIHEYFLVKFNNI